MDVGIEAINAYGGQTYLDVRTLFEARGLDLDRFDNLMMGKKAVGLPCEDPVTSAVFPWGVVIAGAGTSDRTGPAAAIAANAASRRFLQAVATPPRPPEIAGAQNRQRRSEHPWTPADRVATCAATGNVELDGGLKPYPVLHGTHTGLATPRQPVRLR